MDLGLHVVSFTYKDGPASIAKTLATLGATAEQMGLSHLSVMDHYFQMELGSLSAEMDMLEAYTTLGFLAAHTSKIRLGVLVTGVGYRYPGLLAKIVTTLDVLSEGRAELGIGAGWYEREHKALGVPFYPTGERLGRLDETLQICLQMWSENDGPFEGQYYQLAETMNVPQSLQRPHPPIMIGGAGEKVLLKLVARYANACNLMTHLGLEGITHKLEVLRGHCKSEGTDYDAIRKTLLWTDPVPDDPAEFVDQAGPYAEAGIEEIIVMPFSPDPVGWTRGLAASAEALRAM